MHNIIGKLTFYKRPLKRSVLAVAGCALALSLAAAPAISPIGVTDKVMAASPVL